MATKRFHRITSFLLAGLMLVSATGFSVDMHFCQNEFKSLALFGEAQNCHERAALTCHHAVQKDNATAEQGNDCCSNKSIEVAPSDDERVPVPTLTSAQTQFIAVFVATFLLPAVEAPTTGVPYLNYRPPLLLRDIPVLVQSFLI